MLWFKFILGLNFIFFCFKVIIIHYRTQKQKKIKFEPRIKLNHNIYMKTRFSKQRWRNVRMARIVVLNDSVLQGSLSNHCSNTPDTSDVKLNI